MEVLTLKGPNGWGYIGDLHMSVYFTYMRAKVCVVHVPLLATVEMAVRKSVVVQCGTFKCLVTFQKDAMDERTERDVLEQAILVAHKERIGTNDLLTLQVKSEEWDGMLIDCFQDTIQDRMKLTVVVEKAEVSSINIHVI